jgi:hypothetical protein
MGSVYKSRTGRMDHRGGQALDSLSALRKMRLGFHLPMRLPFPSRCEACEALAGYSALLLVSSLDAARYRE